jgi:hypothetical protein
MGNELTSEAHRLTESSPGRQRQVSLWSPDSSDPAFKAEYRRQMAAVAEHDRLTMFADRIEPDETDLLGWA